MNAILGICSSPFCFGKFTRTPELKGGVFYGTALREARTGAPIFKIEGLPYSLTFEEFQPQETILPLDNDGIPVTLVRGSQDGIAITFDVEETYDQIQHPPKALVTVFGANHYGITNVNNPPEAIGDRNNPTLAQDVAIETIARWSALSLRAYVIKLTCEMWYLSMKAD
jgi:fermentation-respiration switch protein FrsA (DUF1100 family)